jgi:hypothetical protein
VLWSAEVGMTSGSEYACAPGRARRAECAGAKSLVAGNGGKAAARSTGLKCLSSYLWPRVWTMCVLCRTGTMSRMTGPRY